VTRISTQSLSGVTLRTVVSINPARAGEELVTVGIFTIGAAVLLQAAADAGPSSPYPSVFGIQMMAPINIPECRISPVVLKHPEAFTRDSFSDRYDYSTNTLCYKRIGARGGSTEILANEALNIAFPSNQEPQLASAVSAEIIDGRVQGVSFSTYGIAVQDLVLSSLEQKFGKPQNLTTTDKQNGFGAKFNVTNASWKLPNEISVTFEGALSSINAGSVSVLSPAARAEQEQQRRKLLNAGTPL
jgi:hypothetical protein